jgi:hypothetical protein
MDIASLSHSPATAAMLPYQAGCAHGLPAQRGFGEKVHSRPCFTAALNWDVRPEDTLPFDRNIAQASDLEIRDRLRLAQPTQMP